MVLSNDSGSMSGLDTPVRGFLSYPKKDKKRVKRLARLLRERFAFELVCHEWSRTDRHAIDRVGSQISASQIFLPVFTDNARQSSWILQATDYAIECGLPVVAITTGSLPHEIAAKSSVVTVSKKFSDLEERLRDVDFGAILKTRQTDANGERDQPRRTAVQADDAPTASVVAVVHRSHTGDDGILLMRRRDAPSEAKWSLPSGDIQKYETSKDAVVRVVRAETGLDFNASFLTYFDEILPRCSKHSVVIGFVGPGLGDATPDPKEVAEIAWRPVLDALTLDLVATHREVLEVFVEGV